MRFFQVSILTQWPTLIQFKSKIIHYSTEKVWNCLLDCAHTLSVQNIVWMAFLPHSLRRVMMQLQRQPSFDISVFMHPHTMEKGESSISKKSFKENRCHQPQNLHWNRSVHIFLNMQIPQKQIVIYSCTQFASCNLAQIYSTRQTFLQKSHWILI